VPGRTRDYDDGGDGGGGDENVVTSDDDDGGGGGGDDENVALSLRSKRARRPPSRLTPDENRVLNKSDTKQRSTRRIRDVRRSDDSMRRSSKAHTLRRLRATAPPAAAQQGRDADAAAHRRLRTATSLATAVSHSAQLAAASTSAAPIVSTTTTSTSSSSSSSSLTPNVVAPMSVELDIFETNADAALLRLWESTGAAFLLPGAPLEPVTCVCVCVVVCRVVSVRSFVACSSARLATIELHLAMRMTWHTNSNYRRSKPWRAAPGAPALIHGLGV
jgi:hypothetical protein